MYTDTICMLMHEMILIHFTSVDWLLACVPGMVLGSWRHVEVRDTEREEERGSERWLGG